jgi:putative Mg2+ transporter-C (MgtC) family protein
VLAVAAIEGIVALKLAVACLLGGIIGLDREASGKPAGFRTHILICVGATLITLLSIGIATSSARPGDPGRIAAQIVSGVGFIGAGTIIRSGGSVRGLTTAATLWVVAAIGMAVGADAWFMAVSTTLVVWIALRILHRVENRLIPDGEERAVLRVKLRDPGLLHAIEQTLSAHEMDTSSVQVVRVDDGIEARYRSRGGRRRAHGAIAELMQHDGVREATLD